MKSAYNHEWLRNLMVVKEAAQWMKDRIITSIQHHAISEHHKSGFFHPNLMIRILLFIASLIALGGVTGILGLLFSQVLEDAIEVLCLVYGVGSLLFLDVVFIKNSNHYKSGVTEALLYHSMGFIIGGIAGLSDFDTLVTTITCLTVFAFCAFRYLDLITTFAALCAFGYLIFFEMYEMGGLAQQLIPVAFIATFTPLYFYFRSLRNKPDTELWDDCLIVAIAFCLLAVYAAGNYFVVRELSIELMDLQVGPDEDIPFAVLFYALTVIIPIAYLYFGVRNRDVILLRTSLVAIAFSVFTFKYYFSLGHPEFTLTAAGVILLAITFWLFRYLREPKHGYTRENLIKEKWADANPQAFIMSQTLGGNQVVVDDSFKGGGGGFSGGGATGDF